MGMVDTVGMVGMVETVGMGGIKMEGIADETSSQARLAQSAHEVI